MPSLNIWNCEYKSAFFRCCLMFNPSLLTVRLLREELQLLQEQGSYVGEVVKPMDKKKVLVKVHPEGKFVVDIDKNIDINQVTPNARVALRNDSYTLHKILPNKVNCCKINQVSYYIGILLVNSFITSTTM